MTGWSASRGPGGRLPVVDAVLREVVEEDVSLVASPVASHLLDGTHDELVSGWEDES